MYEIGTAPYFSNVAPGEVTEVPTEAPLLLPESHEDGDRIEYTDEQHVEYPPYETEGEQIRLNPAEYQPHQPGNPEVVVVDDTDINVDGESTSNRTQTRTEPYNYTDGCLPHALTVLLHAFSLLIQLWDVCKQPG